MTEKSFEQNLEKLENLVTQLEQGDLPLEEAIKLFQEGMRLSGMLTERLATVEKEVKKLVAEGDKLRLEKLELADAEDKAD
jgi:exodeoxyribonuclease VII small subunit